MSIGRSLGRGRYANQLRKNIMPGEGQIARIVDFRPRTPACFSVGNMKAFVHQSLNGSIEKHAVVATTNQIFVPIKQALVRRGVDYRDPDVSRAEFLT